MSLFRQFTRFAAVGATGTLIQYLSLWVGVEFVGISAALASGIGYVFGSIVNYLFNYFFTFESGNSHTKTISKYYSVLGVGWCINTGIMGILVNHFAVRYWFAQMFATGIGLVWNFTGSRFWAFKHSVATE